MSLVSVLAQVSGAFAESSPTLLFVLLACAFFQTFHMSTYHYEQGAIHNDNHTEVNINTSAAGAQELLRTILNRNPANQPQDVEPIDTSFFATERYTADVCERNLREAITQASGKADACRRIMLADTCGYIHLRQFTDARKAELINPFAAPDYIFTADDFCNARRYKKK